MKKFFKYAGLTVLVLVVGLFILKKIGDARYYSDYDPNLALNVEEGRIEKVEDTIEVFGIPRDRHFQKQHVVFQARVGEPVPTLVTLPIDYKPGDPKLPVIVFLHGSGQKKDFLLDITTPMNDGGFAMACFDQHGCGERKTGNKSLLGEAGTYLQRAGKTVNDGRRLIDYLQTRPEIDPERIYLVGASYGAITGTVLVAKDKRIKAADLVVGGGDISVMLDAPLIKGELDKANVPRFVQAMAKSAVVFLMGVADPVRHAPNTAPTPVFMQNGSDDMLVWPKAGDALFAALAEPKEIKWYPIDHPGLRKTDGPEILRLLDDGLAWLTEQDKPYRLAAQKKEMPALAAAS